MSARLHLAALAALAIPFAAGCKDKACIRWNDADRAAYTATASSSAASSSSGGGSGGAGGAGSSSSGSGSSAAPLVAQCPDRTLAKQLLANPSCAESIESIDSDGSFEDDSCCYEVTTASKSCSSESSP